ncbi:response regulator [Paenarthrobacter nicotinovorans]|uniref:response regulator n=1 Tax=Paenarthrobacter nicotinovorans TaxID=29320 RepID=UPI0037480B35
MTKVLIVDDQEMIRVGLCSILETREDIDIVGDVGDAFAALELLERVPVDLVVMDLRMPGIDGVEATRRIRQSHPEGLPRILVLTTFDHDENVFAALRAGANGFLSKGVRPAELIAGILEVAAGGGALSSTAAAALITQVGQEPSRQIDAMLADRFQSLTPRERDVVVAIASGQTNDEIASELRVSPYTVKTHANRSMSKVGARDRAQLVAFAFRAGLG